MPEPNETLVGLIPEEYKDRPWVAENTKDPDTFFKFVDNQNSLIGKKGVIVPEEGAPKEVWDTFHKTLGRPDSADGYEFEPIAELKDSKRDAEFEKSLKGLLFEAGVPKATAKKLQQGFDKLLFEKTKGDLELARKEDEAFANLNKEFFGDDREKIVAGAQKILKDILPEKVLLAMDKMTSEQLSMVIAVTDAVYRKYGKEDGFKGGAGGPGSGGGESYEELSAQQRELMKNPGFTDWRHAEHAGLMEKNNEILAKMRLLKK